MEISIPALKKSIELRHHAMERFYDIEAAALDKLKNEHVLDRIERGIESDEDIETALELIRSPY